MRVTSERTYRLHAWEGNPLVTLCGADGARTHVILARTFGVDCPACLAAMETPR
jgi:hypothetical protein